MELTLHDLFPNDWGAHQPARLSGVLEAEYADLDETARGLRALAVEAIHGFERRPVLTAENCRELLEKHHLPKARDRWSIVALNSKRERVYARSTGGGMRMVAVASEEFPTPAVVARKAKLPEGGFYLAIYGGSPSVLNDEDAFTKFAAFAGEQPIVDVVLWDDSDKAATFWSTASEAGTTGSDEFDFPTDALVARWRDLLCTR